MTRSILGGAMLALFTAAAPAALGAQAHEHHGSMHQGDSASAHGMKTPCPLHMTTLGTTPAQDSAIGAIRKAHMEEMKAMHARHTNAAAQGGHGAHAGHGAHRADSSAAHTAEMKAEMKASMGRAIEQVSAVLNETQRAQLQAAVAAHDAEKAARARDGAKHDCAECCRMHEGHGSSGMSRQGHEH